MNMDWSPIIIFMEFKEYTPVHRMERHCVILFGTDSSSHHSKLELIFGQDDCRGLLRHRVSSTQHCAQWALQNSTTVHATVDLSESHDNVLSACHSCPHITVTCQVVTCHRCLHVTVICHSCPHVTAVCMSQSHVTVVRMSLSHVTVVCMSQSHVTVVSMSHATVLCHSHTSQMSACHGPMSQLSACHSCVKYSC